MKTLTLAAFALLVFSVVGCDKFTKTEATQAESTKADPAITWLDASKKAHVVDRDLHVSIASVVRGKVPLSPSFDDSPRESSKEHLIVKVTLNNKHSTKKYHYTSWMEDFATPARLLDNNKNIYKRIDFGFGEQVGLKSNNSIYPNSTITDTLVFEVPVKNISYLELTLPGENVISKSDINFRIPASYITVAKKP